MIKIIYLQIRNFYKKRISQGNFKFSRLKFYLGILKWNLRSVKYVFYPSSLSKIRN